MSHSASHACLAILLAAGEGKRMRSALPKPLHPVAGRSMLAHALAALRGAGADRVAVVVGPDGDSLAAEARRVAPESEIFVQRERLGTAHAVLAAREAIGQGWDEIVVAYADTPLISPETFRRLRAPLADGASLSVLGFEAANPTGYGRLIERDGALVAIREHKDATPAERAIHRCSAGPVAFLGEHALERLDSITPHNAAKEFYLTDLVEILAAQGFRARAVVARRGGTDGRQRPGPACGRGSGHAAAAAR